MKSPTQRMIAQRRLALVTERTPLQTPEPVAELATQWRGMTLRILVDDATMARAAMITAALQRLCSDFLAFNGIPLRFTDKLE